MQVIKVCLQVEKILHKQTIIDSIVISTAGNATDFGDLSVAKNIK
jgi:hypothetical protein